MNNALCKIVTEEAFKIVTIKLIDPNKELNPTICNEKKRRSTEEELIILKGT